MPSSIELSLNIMHFYLKDVLKNKWRNHVMCFISWKYSITLVCIV